MKQNRIILSKIAGWIFFLLAVGFFSLQMGYFFAHERFQIEYIDNRLFYIINSIFVICLYLALLLLIRTTKTFKFIGAGIVIVFITVHMALLFDSNKEVKNVTSLSPDFKHVLSIKEDVMTGEAVYYRAYYGILARPKEKLPCAVVGDFKVEWLAKDIVAVTYKTIENTIQQYIGTYGDRKNGRSYYYVGAEIHGIWQAKNIEVISNQEGISVTQGHETEMFTWDNIEQYGTLAVVLKKNNEAIWTIALNENFEVDSASSEPTVGNISLYKASLENNQPVTLEYITGL